MGALSTRQHRLIDLLLEQQHGITIAYAADVLGISPRTVHRELTAIETYLSGFGILLKKKSGSGIRIAGTEKQLQALQAMVHTKHPSDMEASERKIVLLCTLLKQDEPIKLYSLAHELRVTMPTVGYDLDELEAIVTTHDLQLVRRRGYGIELTGHERNKRQLAATVVTSYLDDSQLISYAHSDDSIEPIAQQLLLMVGQQHFQAIEQVLWSMNLKLNEPLEESTYTLLLLQMSISMTRYLNGHCLPKLEKAELKAYEELPNEIHEVTSHIIDRLELALPIEEMYHLAQLMKQALEHDQQLQLYTEQPYLTQVVHQLSLLVEKELQEPISTDPSLSEGLVKHMLPAIKRINEGQTIRNPMLSQIRKDYAQLFAVVAKYIKALLPQLQIPEEEIGYITMHYGAAIERMKQIPKQLRAVLVCTSGIGSSKLLATRLAKEFPQIEQIGHYSWYEAARIPKSNYDFIVSTVTLPLEASQYIRLSPLITDEEIIKLKQYIKLHVLPASHEDSEDGNQLYPEGEQWFRELHQISQAALQIINPFDIYQIPVTPSTSTVHELLPVLLHNVENLEVITNIDAVTNQLLLREEQGSIVLPDTALALLHARDEAVIKPFLALFRLDSPLPMRDDEEASIQHILLMLAPKQLDKYSLEILSEISAMLLQPELTKLLQYDHANQIKSFISTQLEKHIKQKLNWRD